MSFQTGTYILSNVKTATKDKPEEQWVAMDLSGGDQQSIIAFGRHGGDNQQWDFQEFEGGYSIQNVKSKKYLTFPDDAVDGKQVIATDGPRAWEVRVGYESVNTDDKRESIRIFVPGTNKNLDLKDHGDPTAGNIVQLWERTPGKGQAWYFDLV